MGSATKLLAIEVVKATVFQKYVAEPVQCCFAVGSNNNRGPFSPV